MPNDTAAVVEAPVKYVPPPKPSEPLADVAAILSNGDKLMYRNETFRVDFRTDTKKDSITFGQRKPSFWVTVPVPTWEMVQSRVSGEHGDRYKNYILDLVQNEVIGAARSQVNDEEKTVSGQDDLDLKLLDFDYLVNEPASARRGKGIAKEIWEAFGQDYLEVMPTLTGKSKDRINNQVKLLLSKFAPVRTQKSVISKLQSELEVYMNSPRAEEFADILEFLVTKANNLLNMTEESVLNSI